jgi:hypothetical protein
MPLGAFLFVMAVAAVLIFITGLAFLPAAYAWARRRYLAEQQLLQREP